MLFVTLWLWRRYQKKIISGMKFAVLFLLALVVAYALYIVLSLFGGAFLLGFGSASVILLAVWAADKFFAVKSEEKPDVLSPDIPILDLPKMEKAISRIYFVGENSIEYADGSNGYKFVVDKNQQTAMRWLERAARHGSFNAQDELIANEVYANKNYAAAHFWICIRKLCRDYIRNLSDEDKKILEKVSDASYRYDSEKIYRVYGHYRNVSGNSKYEYNRESTYVKIYKELSSSQMAEIEKEANSEFEAVKKFMDSMLEAYKAEESDSK